MAQSDIVDFILAFPESHAYRLLQNSRRSKSQVRQDLFVLSQSNFKRNGYFVEFGAGDGINLSNTYLLEKEFGWRGILSEPARTAQKSVVEHRNARIETRCVWKASDDIVKFNETPITDLSTIEAYTEADGHAQARRNGDLYDVTTISLNDLLLKHEAPEQIDYLSIDTEGSEFDILSAFDFTKYDIKIITCEHNYTAMRERIHELLTANGYFRKHTQFSEQDDWYVRVE